jgi:hypothetical protein
MQEMRPLPRRFSAATKAFISTQRTAQHQLHIPINRITDNTNNKQNKDYTEKRILSTGGNVGRALCFALCMVPLRSQVIYPRVLTSLQKLGPQQASRAAKQQSTPGLQFLTVTRIRRSVCIYLQVWGYLLLSDMASVLAGNFLTET